jgi:hypothetical protein
VANGIPAFPLGNGAFGANAVRDEWAINARLAIAILGKSRLIALIKHPILSLDRDFNP